MQCPRCDTMNPTTNTYCDQCGSSLQAQSYMSYSSGQAEYFSQPDYALPPQQESPSGIASQTFMYQKIYQPHPKITFFRVIRAILYFIAVFIAGFGLAGEFISISNSQTMVGLGIFFWLGLIVAGVVLFIRTRQRIQRLGVWPLVGWICGATVGTLMAMILEFSFMPDINKNPVSSFTFGCIILLYGLILAGAAWW